MNEEQHNIELQHGIPIHSFVGTKAEYIGWRHRFISNFSYPGGETEGPCEKFSVKNIVIIHYADIGKSLPCPCNTRGCWVLLVVIDGKIQEEK